MSKIKIGCSWWGFREKHLEEHFRICSRFGFKTLEFGIGDELISTVPAGIDRAGADRILALGKGAGIRLPFATIENDFTLASPGKHRQMVDHALRTIGTAALFNVSHIRIFAGFMPADEVTGRIYSQVIDAFKECNEAGLGAGMRISIETHGRITEKGGVTHHENTISTDPLYLKRLQKDLPPEVGFNYDPGNIKAVRPDDRSYCLDILNGRINYCHLKDWKRKDGGWVAAAIGDDDLDYAAMLSAIRFDGTYLVEYEPLEDLNEGIKRSLDYLRRMGYSLEFV